MRFGLQLAPLAGNTLQESCASAVQIAAAAEKFDFDILIAPQHYRSAPYNYPHALTLTAYIAARTSKWVGTGVLPLPLLNPVDLAEQMSTLAGLTGGRCVLGVGLGYRVKEFELFTVPQAERAVRFEANLAALRQLWPGEPVPVWIGASARAGIVRAALSADAWIAAPTAGPDEIGAGLALYRAAGGQAGTASPLPIRRDVLLVSGAREREAAVQRVRQRYGIYASWRSSGVRPGNQVPFAAAVGDIDEIITVLRQLRETVGGPVLAILRLAWPGMGLQEVINQVRLVGRHVIPQLLSSSGS